MLAAYQGRDKTGNLGLLSGLAQRGNAMNDMSPAVQQAVHEINMPFAFEYLRHPARYKGAHGGRGSAKTLSFGGQLVIDAFDHYEKILCAREIQNSIAESSKATLELKIREMNLSSAFNITDQYINCHKTGSTFLFKGLRNNPQSILSLLGITKCWVDQAEGVSEKSLELLKPTIREPNSELWFSWNPRLASDPVDMLLRGPNPPPRSIVREVNYVDNPYFPDVLREEMEYDRRHNIEKYNWIWLGKYLAHEEARVFRNWKVHNFLTPDDAVFRYGADWGFSVDPTVLIRCFRYPQEALIAGYDPKRTIYIDFEAYKVGCEIDRTPALFDTIQNGHARKWTIRADSARPDTISYMKRHGYNKIVGAVKGPKSIEDGIEFLQSYDIVIHPRCQHAIDEFTLYSWKVDKQTKEILPILADKFNNVIDAARYAVEGERRSGTYTLDNVG